MRRLLTGVLALFVIASRADAGANDYFTEFVKDFGVTPRGPTLTHYFAVKNTTNQTVTIGQPRVSCGCVAASVQQNTLAPGESTTLTAQMDTRRIQFTNAVKAVTVYVPFLSPTLEEVSLKVQAIARDDLAITPDGLNFGTVRKGQVGTASVKVTFFNDAKWEVTEAKSSGIYVKAEAKLVSRKGNEVVYEIVATLDLACPAGVWSADVWVKTSNAGVEKFRIPVSVSVVAPLAVNPDSVKLADLRLGESVEHKVILRGNHAFKVLEVKGGDESVRVRAQSENAMPVHVLTIAVNPKAAGEINRTFEILTDNKEQAKVSLTFKVMVK